MLFAPIAERLERLSIPEPNSGCRIWLGSIWDGYGCFTVGRKSKRAHIASWEEEKGPVPEGMELDHKCRVRCCIEVSHLEPVIHEVNVQRGLAAEFRNFICEKCGSPYEVLQNARGRNPIRGCRSCTNERRRERRKCYQ
jgi:hypothetical protein